MATELKTIVASIDELMEQAQPADHSAPLNPIIDIGHFVLGVWPTMRAALTAAEQVRASEPHELVAFLTLWAGQYQRDYKLDGLHPTHYTLMEKYGCRMDSFKKATNANVTVD